MPADDAADRVGEGRDFAHSGGKGRHALLVETQPVDERLPDALVTPTDDVAGVRLDDARRGVEKGDGDRFEHPRLVVARERGSGAGGLFGALQAHLWGLVGHPPSL